MTGRRITRHVAEVALERRYRHSLGLSGPLARVIVEMHHYRPER